MRTVGSFDFFEIPGMAVLYLLLLFQWTLELVVLLIWWFQESGTGGVINKIKYPHNNGA
jgi:hypothetical protein